METVDIYKLKDASVTLRAESVTFEEEGVYSVGVRVLVNGNSVEYVLKGVQAENIARAVPIALRAVAEDLV